MNLLGKILVVLILVMSLVFMTSAVMVYSMHRNWKDLVTLPRGQQTATQPLGLRFQLEDARQARQELENQKAALEAQLAAEQEARATQVAKLETEKAQLLDERNRLAQEEAELQQDLREAVASVQSAQSMLTDKLAEVDALRQQINNAIQRRDDEFRQVVSLTDNLNQTQAELNRLKDSNVRLSEQIARAKLILDRNGLTLASSADGSAPQLDGVVLASTASGLVEISLGSDDGVERGQRFIVYRRGGTYLAQIEIVETRPDRAVARVIPETRKGPIERDDRVATRVD